MPQKRLLMQRNGSRDEPRQSFQRTGHQDCERVRVADQSIEITGALISI